MGRPVASEENKMIALAYADAVRPPTTWLIALLKFRSLGFPGFASIFSLFHTSYWVAVSV